MRTLILPFLLLVACGGTSPAIVAPVQTAQEQPTERHGSLNCAATLLNNNRSVVVTTSELRHNPTGRKFADQTSSASMPLEMCSVDRQLEILMELRCDDGSNPFTDHENAHHARLANVGASGRCSGVVDHYRVPCPERNYDLFMDSYVCEIDELSDDASAFAMLKVGSADLPLPINWSLLTTEREPFVATLVSNPTTKMTAISIVAIVTEAEAQQVLTDNLSSYSVPLELNLPPRGELQSTDYGESNSISLLWQPGTNAHAKGRLFISLGGNDNPHMNRLHSIAPDILEALTPNEHVVANFFKFLDRDAEMTLEFKDEKSAEPGGSDEVVSISAQKINGHITFVPLHWDVHTWESGFSARKTIKTGQLRYIYVLSEGVHPNLQKLARDHMTVISQGALIAYQVFEDMGIHTIHEHSGNRLLVSSFDTPLGKMQCMLTGPIEELSKPEYGHLFAALVRTSWATARVEAEGGLEADEK